MRINQNIMAFNAYRNLSATNSQMGKSLEKLSSGFRINRAADDAAGLVISQNLRAQVSGLKVATRNAQDGISVVQTAEGALNEVHNMLNRMRELAVQAANTGSNDATARAAAQQEIDALTNEIDRISSSTRFGSLNLLDGSFGLTPGTLTAFDNDGSVALTAGNAFTVSVAGGSGAVAVTVDGATRSGSTFASYLQSAIQDALNQTGNAVDAAAAGNLTVSADAVGGGFAFTINNGGTTAITVAESAGTPLAAIGFTPGVIAAATGTGGTFQVGANATDTITVSISAVTSATLSINSVDVTTGAGASSAITALDAAIGSVSTLRGSLGAYQNRFESTIANLQVTTENLASSESRIRDTDMALEMVTFTRNQILQQAGTAMLAQANQLPQSVLRLLQ